MVTFEGRLNRQPYFGRLLLVSIGSGIVNLILSQMMISTGSSFFLILQLAVILFVLVYSFSLTIRRLHDIGRAGWWSLVSFVPFLNLILAVILLLKKGDEGENSYGADPLAS